MLLASCNFKKYNLSMCRKTIVEMDQKEGLIRLTNPKGEYFCSYESERTACTPSHVTDKHVWTVLRRGRGPQVLYL